MNKNLLVITTLVIGIALGVGASYWLNQGSSSKEYTGNNMDNAPAQPLYWVAPMDANFRKDKAGLSPMGMALVPVYATSGDDDAGVVTISPTVVNNMGVRTAVVEFGALEQTIHTTGLVQFDGDHRVDIHPRVEGWIEKLHVKSMGDWVKKGEPLYDLYSPELVNAQEELVLAVEQRNTRLIRAATRRLDALLVPEITINKIKKTRQVSNSLTIFAPMSGVVDAIYVREGGFVKPAVNLLTISALKHVWVNVDIFESQAKQVNVGDEAMMSVSAFPTKQWRASVDKIYPRLNKATRTLQVRLRVDNSDYALKPNMYVNVTLLSGKSASTGSTVLVPNEAVIRTGRNNRVVMALGEGKFKSVAVNIGLSNDQFTQVMSGLEPSDEVVVSAQFLIDSESNISSDLKRYHNDSSTILEDSTSLEYSTSTEESMMDMGSASAEKVWVKGTVQRVMSGHDMLNISHDPIEAWDWPKMTMNFYLDESLSIDDFKKGQVLEFEIMADSDGDYIITNVKGLTEKVESNNKMMGHTHD
jgi:Cu(I)/Ag(I) efflux system membrane fusion protein